MSPDAAAISITATRRDNRHGASTGVPSGPVTVSVRLGPPRTSRNPSPPSAIGTSVVSCPSSQRRSAMARAITRAVAVPLNLSGAMTTRTVTVKQRRPGPAGPDGAPV